MGEVDREQFQQGLDKLMEWSNTWQMAFNKDKCHVLHLGRQNQRFEYSMGGVKLGAAEWEKDLGVIARLGRHCTVYIRLTNPKKITPKSAIYLFGL